MKELLSNEEIDSLLALFRAESGSAPDAPQGAVHHPKTGDASVATASPLDLLKPNRIGRDRMHLVERLLASVAKATGAVLGERLRLDAVCDCVSVEQVRFSSWRRQLEGPIGVWTIAAPPLAAPIVLTMTGDLVRGAVDRLLGGSGRVDRTDDAFTPAEFAVADALVESMVECIAAAFAEVVPLQPRIDTRSANPATVQAMAPADVALCGYFQIGGEVLRGDLRLAFPCHDLEPYLERLARGRAAPAGKDDAGSMSSVVGDVPLRIGVVLGRTRLRVQALLGLRPGDIVRLERRVHESVEAEVGGITRLRGKIARRGSARVMCVEEVLEDGEARQ